MRWFVAKPPPVPLKWGTGGLLDSSARGASGDPATPVISHSSRPLADLRIKSGAVACALTTLIFSREMPVLAQLSCAGVTETLFLALVIVAAVSDHLTRRIPNAICLLICADFSAFAICSALPPAALGMHLLCGAVILAAGFAIYAAGAFGGGDAKLLASCSLWLGSAGTPPMLLKTALAGGVLAVAYLIGNAMSDPSGGEKKAHQTIPYGVAIATGCISVFLNSFA